VSLQDFREKYPIYNDVDDKTLVTALHKKYGEEKESLPTFATKIKATQILDVGEDETLKYARKEPRLESEQIKKSYKLQQQADAINMPIKPEYSWKRSVEIVTKEAPIRMARQVATGGLIMAKLGADATDFSQREEALKVASISSPAGWSGRGFTTTSSREIIPRRWSSPTA